MSDVSKSSDKISGTANDKGWTPLACAAEAGNIDRAVELLADVDVGVDARDYDGCTPLALAARNGHAAVVARLLTRGANPSLRDLEQVAPLWHAARHGHASVVRLLLASGRLSDVNPRPINLYKHESETPLAIALKEGHQETAGLLARADGIDPCVKNGPHGSETAIFSILGLAVRDGYEDVALTLLDKCDLGHGSKDTGSSDDDSEDNAAKNAVEPASKLLVFAAGARCSQIVRELLAKHGADVNAVYAYTGVMDDYVEQSPLMAASRRGHTSVVRLLLDTEGIRPSLSAYYGVTALILAAEGGFVDVIKILVADARVEAGHKDENGRTALSHAAEHAHEAVVAELLATGAIDPDSQDNKARTPLIWAVDPEDGYGPLYEGVVRMLLANGRVNPNSRDSHGYTPLSYAAERGGLGLVMAILEHPETDLESRHGNMPLVQAAGVGHADVVQVLLNSGQVDVNAVSADSFYGGTALTVASRFGRENVVQLLLSAPGIDPNVKDESGNTPLMVAASNSRVEIVKQLLATGVDPNIQNGDGQTALFNAARSWFSKGAAEVMRALVEVPGINADLADKMGRTALSLAAEAGSVQYVNILLAVDGVNPDARDMAGRSPLSWVFTNDSFNDRTTDERKEVVQRLLRISAVDPNAEDAEGLTPLLRAIQFYDSNEFVELLLSRTDLDSLKNLLRHDLAREYHLPFGEQQAYITEWAAKSTARLCPVCMAIDLDAAFSNRHTEHRGRVIADLGKVDEAWEKRTCPLCRLFAMVRPRPSVEGGHKLVSFSTTQSWLCHGELVCWHDFKDPWVDTMVLAVVADSVLKGLFDDFRFGDRDWQADDVVHGVLSAGLIGRLGTNCPDQKNAVTIPRLAADRSDLRMSTARGWITCCRQNHSQRCNPRRLATVPHFRLIECSTRRIVEQKESEAGGPPPYVALSYVWGQPPSGQPPPQQQQQQQSLGEEGSGVVEAVIEDAIRVALELGYGYLWVNRYYIVQTGNEAIKQEQLRHMHTVYANAEVTLVAAAGTDASAGLPGAAGRPRAQQPGAFVQGHALVCIPPDPSHHIHSASTWATRGWTYQEGLLARRRLYFSKYEMSYECRDMLCREALRLPPAVEQRMSGRRPRLMNPLWMYEPYRLPGVGSHHNGTSLFDLLAMYSVRQLSLPPNALNAMLGILQVLAEHKSKPVYHVCGVPILCTTDSEFNSNGDSTVAARLALDGFVNGLCWRLQQPAHRRPGFPSWSWTGWQGVVESMHGRLPLVRHAYGFGIDISIIPRNHDGGAVPWNRYYDQLRTADDSSKDLWSGQQHVLEITASAATVWFRKTIEIFDELAKWTGTVCAGDCVWQGEFSLTQKGEGDNTLDDTDSLMSSLLQKPWTGIVLGNSYWQWYDMHDTYVLVVEEQEQKQQQQDEEQRRQPAADTHTY
ncbi:hypothetical protein ACHAPT_001429 [Fusarium lateritium]